MSILVISHTMKIVPLVRISPFNISAWHIVVHEILVYKMIVVFGVGEKLAANKQAWCVLVNFILSNHNMWLLSKTFVIPHTYSKVTLHTCQTVIFNCESSEAMAAGF